MTTPTELLRQAREALAYLLPLAEMQPADVEPGRHLMRGDCPDETQPSSRDAECPACKKMVAAAELIAAIDALPSAPAWPCHCDERGIGKPGVTCGDCPRDYGHTVDSAPSGEPAPTRADLIAALTFYATCGHMNLSDESAWDTVSGEPQNWWCDEAGTATIEDGSLARMALAGDMNADHFAALERGDDVCIDPGTGREAPQAVPVPVPAPAPSEDEEWLRDYCQRPVDPEGEHLPRLRRLLAAKASTAAAAPEPVGALAPLERQEWMRVHAQAVGELRAAQDIITRHHISAPDVLALTGGTMPAARPAPAVAATVQALTDERIVMDGLMMTPAATLEKCADAFTAGVRFAERAHGIATPAPKEQK